MNDNNIMNGNNITPPNTNNINMNNLINGNTVANPNNSANINYSQPINNISQTQQPVPNNTIISKSPESMSKEEINNEILKINEERNKIAGDLQQALSYLKERGIGLNDKIEIDDEEEDDDYDSFDNDDTLEVESETPSNFIEESDEPQNFDIF